MGRSSSGLERGEAGERKRNMDEFFSRQDEGKRSVTPIYEN